VLTGLTAPEDPVDALDASVLPDGVGDYEDVTAFALVVLRVPPHGAVRHSVALLYRDVLFEDYGDQVVEALLLEVRYGAQLE